jgi:hypothetical protein
LSGVGISERTQQDRIHHTENGCVRPDPERERQDRNGGEASVLGQHANAVPKVLEESLHKIIFEAASKSESYDS